MSPVQKQRNALKVRASPYQNHIKKRGIIIIKKNKVFLAAFILLIITVVLMVKPLTSALLTAAFFAYIFHPMYEWLRLRIKSGSIAAILIILLIIAIFVVPVTLAFNTLTGEIFSGYLIIKQKLATAEMGNFALFEAQPQLGEMFGNTLNKITAGIVDYTSTFIF